MSVILDALKKLEQEKRVQAAGPVRLSPEILAAAASPRSRKKPVVVAAAVVCGVLLLAAGYGYRKKSASPVAAAPVLRAETQAEPVPAPRSTVPVATASTASAPVASPSVAASEVTAAAPVAAEAAPVSRSGRARRTRGADRTVSLPQSGPAAVAATSAAPPGDLAVSGIAWQDSRADRRAVINGGLYAEGATVAGNRIVQIMQDRVRFSRDGRSFEVTLTTPFVR